MDKINENAREKVPIKLAELDYSSILISAIVGFIVIAIFVILRKRRSGRRDILLTGLCDSGKTAIFMQTIYKKLPDTFTSITENVGTYASGHMSTRLIDIPGHYRVRNKYFDQYKQTAKAIIFVVDAVTVQKEIRDVADALYTVLTDSATLTCSLAVVCNKQDQTTAKSAQVIKTILEAEINVVRETRSRKLQSTTDEDASKTVFLGKEGKDFQFTQLPQKVNFYECSAKDNQLTDVTFWMDRML